MAKKNRKHQKRRHESTSGFLPSQNPEWAHWDRELRKSSAADRHTPKPRKGTRRERERQAIRDQRRDTKD